LSTVGRFGVAEPDQCAVGLQLPSIVIDHELSVPVLASARSWILSCQVPAVVCPLNAVTGRFVNIMS